MYGKINRNVKVYLLAKLGIVDPGLGNPLVQVPHQLCTTQELGHTIGEQNQRLLRVQVMNALGKKKGDLAHSF